MAERPILMNSEMVSATVGRRKRVTRRPYRPRRPGPYELVEERDDGSFWPFSVDEAGQYHELRCQYGMPGDRLYVRETWGAADQFYHHHELETPRVVAYRADKSAVQFDANPPCRIPNYDIEHWNWDSMRWRPSIHMPKWAARIWLPVASVRFERLGDINDAEANLEGFEETEWRTATGSFLATWRPLYGEGNHWVWRIEWSEAEILGTYD